MVKIIKKRIKRSIIWKMPHNILVETVSKSITFKDILKVFGLTNKGGNCNTLKRRLKEENIDFNHIKQGINSNKGRKFPEFSMSKEECLKNIYINNSTWNRVSVKRYIKKYNLLSYECECGLKDEWKNKKLSLQLDHKDGNGNNNLLENLRWLCPNCHSQTETFCGKKLKSIKRSVLNPNWKKNPRLNQRKVERPSKEKLLELTKTMPMIKIGKMYGVSDNAIRKWIKSYEY